MPANFRVSPLHAALLLTLALPATGHAQTASSSDDNSSATSQSDTGKAKTLSSVHVTGSIVGNDYETDTSTVGAKVPTSLRDIPQTVVVVNRDLLDAQGATSLQDALRNVPGITIGGAEGGQIGNNINLRGFTARTDIYLDGFRDPGQYYRDVFDLDAIEVLKGPSSMLFGRGSTGGVINQVTKEPELKSFGEVTATVGTDDRYRTTADFNQQLSSTSAARLNVYGQDMHSTRDVQKNQDFGIAPSVRFGIGTPTQITLSALIQRNHDMPDYGLPPVNGHPADVSYKNWYGLTDDRTNQNVNEFNARLEHAFSDTFKLRTQLMYSQYDTNARETAANSVVTNTGVTLNKTLGNPTNLPLQDLYVQLASHDRVIHDTILDSQTDLTTQFDTGSLQHTLITGVELARETYNNQGYTRNGLPLLSLLNPVQEATPSNVTTTIGNYAQSVAKTAAIYANDTIRFNDQWMLVAGLRRDEFDAHISNTVSLPAYAQQTVYFTSVRGGLIYQPSEQQSYYVSYGTSFDPSLEQLTLTNGTQDLQPEKNRSYEIGGKWNLMDDVLAVNAALYNLEQTNARTQTSSGEYTLDGTIRVRGAELGVVGHLTKSWQIFSGYSYMDGRIVKALDGTQGNVPANTPRNTFTTWTTYTFAEHWEAGGGPTYMSQRYAANTDKVSVGGYTRWDATLAYHQPSYDIRLNVLNLANKRYFDALIQSDGGRSVPGIGRTEMVTFTYKF
ncbi:TonB-dependent receptor [Dyella mobilis]|uniref:TonB-dependent siderophore receptor n=1 Tax=Dyella mobilis TaxID=1849582 RepID=A0ABS2KLJ3_9GAMM|nr:TonB-dependent siderophore receptor [Dyella mobilis]MBM7132036.1 TonB-dependent siderophore receptor [Dyella mobilis]GLQ95979.1 iron transport outer membrane receptor [Dyella mobilis]